MRKRPGRRGGKRDTNRRKRLSDLQKAGLELFLVRGIEGVTIDDIVARARVAKGSFYRYYDDKRALVEALFAPVRARIIDAFAAAERDLAAATDDASLTAAYQALSVRLASIVIDSPELVRLYLQEMRAPAAGDRGAIRRLADLIAARAIDITAVAHERGLLRPFDGRLSARAVVGAVEKLLYAVLSEEDVGDALAIPGALISLVLDGLRPEPAGGRPDGARKPARR